LDILRCVSVAVAKFHVGVEIYFLKLYDTLKINPRIRNYQNHKNQSQALCEDGKKSLKT